MLNKISPGVLLGLCVVTVLPWANRANAITPLTKAEIQELRNIVQLIPKNNSQTRPARRLDTINPGDGVSTGRSSLADLRFNDGSMARVGEQAVFQFLPQSRNFTLSNGTVLLLIPPGRGQTRIKTPNAAAAIRGSALFVRYNEETDTTIIGALTNSGIEVANQEVSQKLVLKAGQLMVVVKGEFQGLYDFDLRNFYEKSDLVNGLDLVKQNSTPTKDPALASVQSETAAAVKAQQPIRGQGAVDNPSFLHKNPNASGSSNNSNNNNSNNNNSNNNNSNNNNGNFGREQKVINRSSRDNLGGDSIRNNLHGPVNSFVITGEVIRENNQGNGQFNNPGQGGGNQGGGNQGGGNNN